MKPSTLQSWKPRINLPCTSDDEQTRTETATTETQQLEGRKLAQGWLQSTGAHERKFTQGLPRAESLPEGIVSKTSNLEIWPLWSSPSKLNNQKSPMNLLAIAVGIKQKKIVDQIVRNFPSKDFVVMLFYYYGVVDERKDLVWADRAIHVSAANQTKCYFSLIRITVFLDTRGRVWFAKHFLHPDIVAEYNYIFLWDEDIGVAIFNPRQYLSIVKDEGLEISQPALDPFKSEVHHLITARRRNSKAHRRIYKFKASGRCDDYSTAPPCIGQTLGRNDGACVFKGCLEMCLVYDLD
ncbi:Lysine ketoglutarate reductase trans-splicing-like protein [Citrus sinensis]|uniref:Lysine ketoglutarate reductase trans-splicing-like protein n=1 Tax=Citrus sinensis TaxID=2711 RepID=A0ACB8K820_CITSI|nr:Lysine ketoglutarate reductase trans-splicing-like protein [Citrus sinensis]